MSLAVFSWVGSYSSLYAPHQVASGKQTAKPVKKSTEQGTISIHSENIFPIIKKWLYSEKEVFLRELISNAVDAVHKMQHVSLVEGLQIADEYRVDVLLDKDNKTVTIKDNGIGMTADEIRRYINQIAFSSAEEFVEKFKNLEDKSQIIGHFGLGFYSAFMVSKKVEIRSLSYQADASGAHWSCDGSTSYELAEIDGDVLNALQPSGDLLYEQVVNNIG